METTESWLDRMTSKERALAKKYVDTWKVTGPILDRLRREELKNVDTFKSVQALSGSFDFSIAPYRPQATSGLVEQQAWFKKIKSD
ncbi:MAG: hypothetical protein M3Y82_04370 [Verrucomicrobiota bacterium]|nr:hypothetical protein [Verrucomicrobiota bacterium]